MPNPEPLRDASSEDARQAMLAFAPRKLVREWVPLGGACGRVLATALVAGGDQPPFDVSMLLMSTISSDTAAVKAIAVTTWMARLVRRGTLSEVRPMAS